jgi:hypothetical protein
MALLMATLISAGAQASEHGDQRDEQAVSYQGTVYIFQLSKLSPEYDSDLP